MKPRLINIKQVKGRLNVKQPFIFGVHHHDLYPKGKNMGLVELPNDYEAGNDISSNRGYLMYHGLKRPGFPYHPHRGFETISIVEQGSIDHFDSAGNKGRYQQGDVQWLNTGKGLLHSEMFPLLNDESDNPLELFQIWLNLSGKNKFSTPSYQMLWKESIPVIELENKQGILQLINGSYNDTKSLPINEYSWANDDNHRVRVWLLDLNENGSFSIPETDEKVIRYLYVYKGKEVEITGQILKKGYDAQIDGKEAINITNHSLPAKILILESMPYDESVVSYGPFVMNTESEIKQAFDDYQNGLFGSWTFQDSEPVNEQDSPRFMEQAKVISYPKETKL